jgi:hypothetical protein
MDLVACDVDYGGTFLYTALEKAAGSDEITREMIGIAKEVRDEI